jgi:exosome complex RNA-binding protein Rrp42 (RNase PH superfamily)
MNKDRQLSNPEREFLQSSLEAKLREDSRQINEFRQVKLNFVKGNWGQVEVLLGRTRYF